MLPHLICARNTRLKSDMPIRRVTNEREKSVVTQVLQESRTEGTGSPASILGT